MRISKVSSYGILAVRYIALHEKERPIRTGDLAKGCGIRTEHLVQALPRLARAHVLRSERGRHGGFCLAKPPTRTTLLEIIEAVDGPMTGEFNMGRSATVPAKARKKLENLLDDIAAYRKAKLGRVTVKQLMA